MHVICLINQSYEDRVTLWDGIPNTDVDVMVGHIAVPP